MSDRRGREVTSRILSAYVCVCVVKSQSRFFQTGLQCWLGLLALQAIFVERFLWVFPLGLCFYEVTETVGAPDRTK